MSEKISLKAGSERADDYYNYSFRYSTPVISSYERLRSFSNLSVAKKSAEILHKDVSGLFPDNVRSYLRRIRRERKRKRRDVLDTSQPLPKNPESTQTYQQPFLRGLTLEEIQDRFRRGLNVSSFGFSYREKGVRKLQQPERAGRLVDILG